MDFNLTENQQLVKDMVRKIAEKELSPKAAQVDKNYSFPRDGIIKLAKADLMGLPVPPEFEGMGADTLSFVLAVEEIAKACASTALIMITHAAVCKGILIADNDHQKKKFLPQLATGERLGAFAVHEANCGSNAGAIETKAIKSDDVYIVNGSKIFITNAKEAEVYLVLVRTDPAKGPQGISMLIIEKGTPGFSFGKIDERMGFNGVSSRELSFQDCRVPKENLLGKEGDGISIVSQALIRFAFFGAAAISLGIAQAALDASIKHAKERLIAGEPIGSNQGIQYLITEMSLLVDTARSLLYWSISKNESKFSGPPIDACKAKLYASEAAIEVTNKAIQVHGGHGYHRELPIERYYRDARGLSMHLKTSELLKGDIARMLMNL